MHSKVKLKIAHAQNQMKKIIKLCEIFIKIIWLPLVCGTCAMRLSLWLSLPFQPCPGCVFVFYYIVFFLNVARPQFQLQQSNFTIALGSNGGHDWLVVDLLFVYFNNNILRWSVFFFLQTSNRVSCPTACQEASSSSLSLFFLNSQSITTAITSIITREIVA